MKKTFFNAIKLPSLRNRNKKRKTWQNIVAGLLISAIAAVAGDYAAHGAEYRADALDGGKTVDYVTEADWDAGAGGVSTGPVAGDNITLSFVATGTPTGLLTLSDVDHVAADLTLTGGDWVINGTNPGDTLALSGTLTVGTTWGGSLTIGADTLVNAATASAVVGNATLNVVGTFGANNLDVSADGTFTNTGTTYISNTANFANEDQEFSAGSFTAGNIEAINLDISGTAGVITESSGVAGLQLKVTGEYTQSGGNVAIGFDGATPTVFDGYAEFDDVATFTGGNFGASKITAADDMSVTNAAMNVTGTGADGGIAVTGILTQAGTATITSADGLSASIYDGQGGTATITGAAAFTGGADPDTDYTSTIANTFTAASIVAQDNLTVKTGADVTTNGTPGAAGNLNVTGNYVSETGSTVDVINNTVLNGLVNTIDGEHNSAILSLRGSGVTTIEENAKVTTTGNLVVGTTPPVAPGTTTLNTVAGSEVTVGGSTIIRDISTHNIRGDFSTNGMVVNFGTDAAGNVINAQKDAVAGNTFNIIGQLYAVGTTINADGQDLVQLTNLTITEGEDSALDPVAAKLVAADVAISSSYLDSFSTTVAVEDIEFNFDDAKIASGDFVSNNLSAQKDLTLLTDTVDPSQGAIVTANGDVDVANDLTLESNTQLSAVEVAGPPRTGGDVNVGNNLLLNADSSLSADRDIEVGGNMTVEAGANVDYGRNLNVEGQLAVNGGQVLDGVNITVGSYIDTADTIVDILGCFYVSQSGLLTTIKSESFSVGEFYSNNNVLLSNDGGNSSPLVVAGTMTVNGYLQLQNTAELQAGNLTVENLRSQGVNSKIDVDGTISITGLAAGGDTEALLNGQISAKELRLEDQTTGNAIKASVLNPGAANNLDGSLYIGDNNSITNNAAINYFKNIDDLTLGENAMLINEGATGDFELAVFGTFNDDATSTVETDIMTFAGANLNNTVEGTLNVNDELNLADSVKVKVTGDLNTTTATNYNGGYGSELDADQNLTFGTVNSQGAIKGDALDFNFLRLENGSVEGDSLTVHTGTRLLDSSIETTGDIKLGDLIGNHTQAGGNNSIESTTGSIAISGNANLARDQVAGGTTIKAAQDVIVSNMLDMGDGDSITATNGKVDISNNNARLGGNASITSGTTVNVAGNLNMTPTGITGLTEGSASVTAVDDITVGGFVSMDKNDSVTSTAGNIAVTGNVTTSDNATISAAAGNVVLNGATLDMANGGNVEGVNVTANATTMGNHAQIIADNDVALGALNMQGGSSLVEGLNVNIYGDLTAGMGDNINAGQSVAARANVTMTGTAAINAGGGQVIFGTDGTETATMSDKASVSATDKFVSNGALIMSDKANINATTSAEIQTLIMSGEANIKAGAGGINVTTGGATINGSASIKTTGDVLINGGVISDADHASIQGDKITINGDADFKGDSLRAASGIAINGNLTSNPSYYETKDGDITVAGDTTSAGDTFLALDGDIKFGTNGDTTTTTLDGSTVTALAGATGDGNVTAGGALTLTNKAKVVADGELEVGGLFDSEAGTFVNVGADAFLNGDGTNSISGMFNVADKFDVTDSLITTGDANIFVGDDFTVGGSYTGAGMVKVEGSTTFGDDSAISGQFVTNGFQADGDLNMSGGSLISTNGANIDGDLNGNNGSVVVSAGNLTAGGVKPGAQDIDITVKAGDMTIANNYNNTGDVSVSGHVDMQSSAQLGGAFSAGTMGVAGTLNLNGTDLIVNGNDPAGGVALNVKGGLNSLAAGASVTVSQGSMSVGTNLYGDNIDSVKVAQNLTVAGTVSGATDFNIGNDLTTGAFDGTGRVDVGNDLTTGVFNGTGRVDVANDAEIAGGTISNTFKVGNDLTSTADLVVNDALVKVGNDMDVEGALALDNAIIRVGNNMNVDNALAGVNGSNVNVGKDLTVGGNITGDLNLLVGGNLESGAFNTDQGSKSTVVGNAEVDGANYGGELNVGGNFTSHGNVNLKNGINGPGKLNVAGDATIEGKFVLAGLGNPPAADAASATIGGALVVEGDQAGGAESGLVVRKDATLVVHESIVIGKAGEDNNLESFIGGTVIVWDIDGTLKLVEATENNENRLTLGNDGSLTVYEAILENNTVLDATNGTLNVHKVSGDGQLIGGTINVTLDWIRSGNQTDEVDELNVGGYAHLSDNANTTVRGDMTVEKYVLLQDDSQLNVGENLTVFSILAMEGGNLTVDGNLDVGSNVYMVDGAKATVKGNAELGGEIYLEGDMTVLQVGGTLFLDGGLNLVVDGATLDVKSLDMNGNTLVVEDGSNLNVTDHLKLQAAHVDAVSNDINVVNLTTELSSSLVAKTVKVTGDDGINANDSTIYATGVDLNPGQTAIEAKTISADGEQAFIYALNGDINASTGSIEATNGADILAGNGNITAAGMIRAGENSYIQASEDITGEAIRAAGDNSMIYAGGNIEATTGPIYANGKDSTIYAEGNITSAGNIGDSVNAVNALIYAEGDMTAEGDINVRGAGSVIGANGTVTSDNITIGADGSAAINAGVSAGSIVTGDINLNINATGAWVQAAGDISANDVNLKGADQAVIADNVNVNDITIDGEDSYVLAFTDINAGDIVMNAGGNVVQAGNDVNANSISMNVGNQAVYAENDVNVVGDINMNGVGNIVQAGNDIMADSINMNGAGQIVTAGNDINVAELNMKAADQKVIAGHDVLVNSMDLNLDADNALVWAGNDVWGAESLTMNGDNQTIYANNGISFGGNITVDGNNALLFAKNGEIFANGDINIKGDNSMVYANTNIVSDSGEIVVDGAGNTMFAKTGDVEGQKGVTSDNGAYIFAGNDVKSNGGDITASNGGTIVAENSVVSKEGNVVADNGTIFGRDGVLAIDGNVVANNGGKVVTDTDVVAIRGDVVATDDGSLIEGINVKAVDGTVQANDKGAVIAYGGDIEGDLGVSASGEGYLRAIMDKDGNGGNIFADNGVISANGGTIIAEGDASSLHGFQVNNDGKLIVAGDANTGGAVLVGHDGTDAYMFVGGNLTSPGIFQSGAKSETIVVGDVDLVGYTPNDGTGAWSIMDGEVTIGGDLNLGNGTAGNSVKLNVKTDDFNLYGTLNAGDYSQVVANDGTQNIDIALIGGVNLGEYASLTAENAYFGQYKDTDTSIVNLSGAAWFFDYENGPNVVNADFTANGLVVGDGESGGNAEDKIGVVVNLNNAAALNLSGDIIIGYAGTVEADERDLVGWDDNGTSKLIDNVVLYEAATLNAKNLTANESVLLAEGATLNVLEDLTVTGGGSFIDKLSSVTNVGETAEFSNGNGNQINGEFNAKAMDINNETYVQATDGSRLNIAESLSITEGSTLAALTTDLALDRVNLGDNSTLAAQNLTVNAAGSFTDVESSTTYVVEDMTFNAGANNAAHTVNGLLVVGDELVLGDNAKVVIEGEFNTDGNGNAFTGADYVGNYGSSLVVNQDTIAFDDFDLAGFAKVEANDMIISGKMVTAENSATITDGVLTIVGMEQHSISGKLDAKGGLTLGNDASKENSFVHVIVSGDNLEVGEDGANANLILGDFARLEAGAVSLNNLDNVVLKDNTTLVLDNMEVHGNLITSDTSNVFIDTETTLHNDSVIKGVFRTEDMTIVGTTADKTDVKINAEGAKYFDITGDLDITNGMLFAGMNDLDNLQNVTLINGGLYGNDITVADMFTSDAASVTSLTGTATFNGFVSSIGGQFWTKEGITLGKDANVFAQAGTLIGTDGDYIGNEGSSFLATDMLKPAKLGDTTGMMYIGGDMLLKDDAEFDISGKNDLVVIGDLDLNKGSYLAANDVSVGGEYSDSYKSIVNTTGTFTFGGDNGDAPQTTINSQDFIAGAIQSVNSLTLAEQADVTTTDVIEYNTPFGKLEYGMIVNKNLNINADASLTAQKGDVFVKNDLTMNDGANLTAAAGGVIVGGTTMMKGADISAVNGSVVMGEGAYLNDSNITATNVIFGDDAYITNGSKVTGTNVIGEVNNMTVAGSTLEGGSLIVFDKYEDDAATNVNLTGRAIFNTAIIGSQNFLSNGMYGNNVVLLEDADVNTAVNGYFGSNDTVVNSLKVGKNALFNGASITTNSLELGEDATLRGLSLTTSNYSDVASSNVNIIGRAEFVAGESTIHSTNFNAGLVYVEAGQTLNLAEGAQVNTLLAGTEEENVVAAGGRLNLNDGSKFGGIKGTNAFGITLNSGEVHALNGDSTIGSQYINDGLTMLGSVENNTVGNLNVTGNWYGTEDAELNFYADSNGNVGQLNIDGVAASTFEGSQVVTIVGEDGKTGFDSANINKLGQNAATEKVTLITADKTSKDDTFVLDSIYGSKWEFSLGLGGTDRKEWNLGAELQTVTSDLSSFLLTNIVAFELPKSQCTSGPWARMKGGHLYDDRSSTDEISYQQLQLGWDKVFSAASNGCWWTGMFMEGDWLYGNGDYMENRKSSEVYGGKLKTQHGGIGAGLYVTRMFQNGWYADVMGRINLYESKVDMKHAWSKDASYKGEWTDQVFTLGAEIGKKTSFARGRMALDIYDRLIYSSMPGANYNISYAGEGITDTMVRNASVDALTNRLGARLYFKSKARHGEGLGNIFVGADYYQGVSGKFRTEMADASSKGQWQRARMGRSQNDLSYGSASAGFNLMPQRNISLGAQVDGIFGDVSGWGVSFTGRYSY